MGDGSAVMFDTVAPLFLRWATRSLPRVELPPLKSMRGSDSLNVRCRSSSRLCFIAPSWALSSRGCTESCGWLHRDFGALKKKCVEPPRERQPREEGIDGAEQGSKLTLLRQRREEESSDHRRRQPHRDDHDEEEDE